MIALPCLPALHVGDEQDCHALGPVTKVALPLRLAPGVGVEETCRDLGSQTFAGVLHACKYPCHANATGLPPLGDSRYLAYRVSDADLTLNMIDPPVPLFSVELFRVALDFLDERLALGPVLIHCNQGLSRAPSLALVYLAKRTGPHRDYGEPYSYEEAWRGFAAVYPAYAPGAGLVTFLTEHWREIA